MLRCLSCSSDFSANVGSQERHSETVVWYQTAFQAFTRTVAVDGPDDLNKPLLHDFVVGLRERGLSPVSCNTYLKALNSFVAWLHAEGCGSCSGPPHRVDRVPHFLQRHQSCIAVHD